MTRKQWNHGWDIWGVFGLVLLATCLIWLAGCAFTIPFDPPPPVPRDVETPLRVATSIGRLACTVVQAEGSMAEIQAAQSAMDAIETSFADGGNPRAAFVIFPRRVQAYISLLLIESSNWTTREFREHVLAFVAGCREILPRQPRINT